MHGLPVATALVAGAVLATGVAGSTASGGLEVGVTLTYWTSWDDQPAVRAVIEGFEHETGAVIEEVVLAPVYEAEVLPLWADGERPDLMTYIPDQSWLFDLDPARTLVDLSGEDFVERDLFGLTETAGRVDGGLYAATFGYPEVYGMLYGRPGADGYSIPTGLDELYQACSDYFASGGEGAFVHIGGEGDIGALHILPSMLWADAVSAGIVDELHAGTTSFMDARIVEAINAVNSGMVRACLNHDDYATATYETQLERVIDGSAAMIPQGISAVADLVERHGIEAVDERVGFFPLSFRSSLASWGARPDTAFLVPVNADPVRQEAAVEFVRYALGEGYDDYVAASGMPPVLDGAEIPAGVPVPVLEAHQAMLRGAAPTIGTAIREPYGDLNQWLYEMLGGTKTPDDVAIAMAETFASMTGG